MGRGYTVRFGQEQCVKRPLTVREMSSFDYFTVVELTWFYSKKVVFQVLNYPVPTATLIQPPSG